MFSLLLVRSIGKFASSRSLIHLNLIESAGRHFRRLVNVKKAVVILKFFCLRDGTRWSFDDQGGRKRGKILTEIPEFETVSGRTPYFCHNLWFISLTNANDPPVLRECQSPIYGKDGSPLRR